MPIRAQCNPFFHNYTKFLFSSNHLVIHFSHICYTRSLFLITFHSSSKCDLEFGGEPLARRRPSPHRIKFNLVFTRVLNYLDFVLGCLFISKLD